MKRFIALITFLSSTSILANGILCYKDARPVDGVYKEVKLEQSQDLTYDLTTKVITPGFGFPVETTETTLATGLSCNLDGLMAYCFKSSATSGDPSNSIVKFEQLMTKGLYSLEQSAAETYPVQIKIEVSSPLISELRRYFSFQVEQNFGGCSQL